MPRSSPSPRRSRSTSARRKPSVESTSAWSRVCADSVSSSLRAGNEQAVRLLRPAPDPAAQLVQLGEPEPVGLLDDHDRRVRDVHADLDHRCRDEDVQFPAGEGVHHSAPLGRREAPVQAADAEALQLGAAQALRLGLGRARLDRLALRHERAHDVGLAPVLEVLAQPRVRRGAPLLGHPRGDDLLAVARRTGDLGHVEVAVDGLRERARNRRRGHVEDVRTALGRAGQRPALLDAEPVLLVHYGHGQRGERDVLLDQCMRADHQLRLAARHVVTSGSVLLGRERAGEQDRRHPKWRG